MKRLPFLLVFFCSFFVASLPAQHSLEEDSIFLQNKIADFETWLAINHLDKAFAVKKLDITPEKVTLTLSPSFLDPTCDTIQATWNILKREFWRQHQTNFHEHLFEKFLFQFELPNDSAELVISCDDPTRFTVRLFYENGGVRLDEQNLASMGTGKFGVHIDSIENLNAGGRLTALARHDFKAVSQKIEQFFKEYYKKRGFWLRYASISVTSFYNEVDLEVTDLKNEVIKDGYFEYHKIKVNIAQAGDSVEVKWKFQGKYGSGIFFPPRQPKDYKDMELKYKDEIAEYENKLFRLLEEFLRQP